MQNPQLRCIHILCHGAPGEVNIGGKRVDEYAWRSAFEQATPRNHTNPIQINFWSCNTGEGETGMNFINTVAQTSNAFVNAASGFVGHNELGGSWDLDVSAKPVAPFSLEAREEFRQVLVVNGLPFMAVLLACALALYVREIILRQRAEAITREQQDRVQINSRFATLGEISAMISHEINQPLAAIELYASTCEKLLKSGANQPETMQQALTGVRSQTERVSRIIRSVQDFAQSRSETPQGLDVMAVIRDLAPLIDLQAKRLKAIVKVQGMTGTHIVADKTMMEQVILNLVRNGLEAMRNTPEDKRLLTIEVSRDDALLNIRITDQGSGIAPELRDRIFSAFVTNKPKGTGVGLSLCKSLVEKHRGHISFSDNPKGGTIFTVELPIELSKSSEVSALRNAVEVVS